MAKKVQRARDAEEGYIEMEDKSGKENKEEGLHDKIGNQQSLLRIFLDRKIVKKEEEEHRFLRVVKGRKIRI